MPFVEPREIGPKKWGKEILLAHTPLYTLKRLEYKAGHQGALQYHVRKDEAFTMASGAAELTWVDGNGVLHSSKMVPGDTFHVPPGTPHKFRAIFDCIVYEASNPIFDDRVNVAEDFGDSDGEAR
jgi:mannose-6-phosphate isomerase-like protein (cupin superfamily)